MIESMSARDCPVRLTANIIGGKWKPLILFYLKRGTMRTGALHQRIAGVSKKMLTQQLRELERDQIIQRTEYKQVPPRVEYSLTKHGESLRPILKLMAEWGIKHRSKYGGKAE